MKCVGRSSRRVQDHPRFVGPFSFSPEQGPRPQLQLKDPNFDHVGFDTFPGMQMRNRLPVQGPRPCTVAVATLHACPNLQASTKPVSSAGYISRGETEGVFNSKGITG